MKKRTVILAVLFLLIFSMSLFAHFQVIMPDKTVVNENTGTKVFLKYIFMHPFEQNYMNMAKPIEAGVFVRSKKIVFTNKLKSVHFKGFQYWETNYRIRKPGDHIFYVIPTPYFEPAESKFIKHITKVVVNAFGLEDSWYKPVGLKAEIVPLTRPYGLWAGNTFRGIVLFKGKPMPNVRVEIEYFNVGKKVKAPNDSFITQVVRTDKNGIFTYTMPKAGWWGFAALMEDDKEIEKNGKKYPVELGAVFWVYTNEMK